MASFIKYTTGEVAQHFDPDGKLFKQVFTPTENVDYVDPDGMEVIDKPKYEQDSNVDLEMVQPDYAGY